MQDEFTQKTPTSRIILIIIGVVLLFTLGIYIGFDLGSKDLSTETTNTANSEVVTTTTPNSNENDSIKPFSTTQQVSESDAMKCNFWFDKEYADHNIAGDKMCGTGSLVVSGKIIKRTESAAWADDGTNVVKIYLKVDKYSDDPQRSFFDCFNNLVKEGNTINDIDGNKLLFNLGFLQDGKLMTSATVSEDVKQNIVNAIDSNDTQDLLLTIPQYGGAGVGDEFTFTCRIIK